jgi:hypothetical protein
MTKTRRFGPVFKGLSTVTLAAMLAVGCTSKPDAGTQAMNKGSGDVPEGYTTAIPDELMTPDSVETSAGTFNFFDGMPDAATAEASFNNLKFIRGYETFLTLMPAASIEMLRHGHAEMGVDGHTKVMLMSPLNSKPLFLTGNTDTVYGSTFFNLKETGPLVIEVPAGLGPGTINDAYFRFVADTGAPGPDKGKGGKYLILGPDDKEPENTDGYFVFRSPTYSNWLIMRAFLDEEGKPDKAVANYKQGVRLYPLAQKDNPPEMTFVEGGDAVYNTVHANNFEFFNELNRVIQREPIDFLDPEIRGLASAIGMEKGKPFNPSVADKKLLEEAVQVGVAYVRSDMVTPRGEDALIYEGNPQWFSAFAGGSYEWLKDGGKGGRNLDARNNFFWAYTVNTPAMVLEMVGVGSQYAIAGTDSEGNYLDGSKTYKLTIDKNPPAKDFWSIVVYDPQTRSQLQTGQPFPAKNSQRNKDMVANDDGSVDVYFGPKAPAGQEANWIETVPGKGWFMAFRLYGPLKPWFDQSWKLNNIEQVK